MLSIWSPDFELFSERTQFISWNIKFKDRAGFFSFLFRKHNKKFDSYEYAISSYY